MKPSYGTSKRHLWISSALAWMIIIAIVAGGLAGSPQAVALANITVPSMILLIASMLGIHRFAGAMDFRSMRSPDFMPPSPPPYLARDEPAPNTGEFR